LIFGAVVERRVRDPLFFDDCFHHFGVERILDHEVLHEHRFVLADPVAIVHRRQADYKRMISINR
jgi:hypothetical protein